MRKTSVYLPDSLKRRLEAAARRGRQSEAQFLRDAVERAVTDPIGAGAGSEDRDHRDHRDHRDPPVPGRLVGVGVGPGAPDLLTVRALRALQRATVVVAPTTDAAAIGRAEAIVREAAPSVIVERAVFVMAPRAAARARALDAVCRRVVDLLDAGEEVAFITLGDPNVYSTFGSVAAGVLARRPDAPIVSIPGVMAFQELAAQTHTALADEQQSLVILPANTDRPLDADLTDPTRTVVIYKGGGRTPEVAAGLTAHDRLNGAVFGELIGLPGERIGPLADVADRPASYLSAVIAPATKGGA